MDYKIINLFFKIITDGHDDEEISLEPKNEFYIVKTRKNKYSKWIIRNEYTESDFRYIAANVLLSEIFIEPEDFF